VLTAKHLGFTAGTSYFANGYGNSLVKAVYTAGPGYLTDDLMLLRLNDPLSGAPVVSLSSTVWSDTTSLAMPVTMTSNSNPSANPRAYGHSTVTQYASTFDIDDNPGTPNMSTHWLIATSALSGPPYVQGGDSGGGLFFGHVLDSHAPLLGIASALLSDTAQTQFASAFVSVAAYRSWIDTTMLNDSTDAQLATWVSTPVPEPTGWTLALIGLLSAAGVRPRQTARTASAP
jgi:Trypsin